MIGNTMPAMAAPELEGKEARGRVLAGLALEILATSIPMLGKSEDAVVVADAYNKLLKKFAKPPADMGEAELKFIGSQIYPQAQSAPGQAAPMDPSQMGQNVRTSLMGAGVPAPSM